ncbi:MAG: GNAT family N-acetyltransferase [Bacteroidota bacterium]|nr:GNAT family N-acetyltransferase [Bacteroidota bacterium]
MNIWIINHYAVTPEFTGGTRHYDLARSLNQHGHNVSVFAAGFIYTSLEESQSYNNQVYSKSKYDGIRWYWIKSKPYQNNSLSRMLNMLTFARNLFKTTKNLSSPDVIIGSTVHPFAPFVASRIAKKRKLSFVFEIRDMWPQTLIDNGTWGKNHPLAVFFRRIEKKIVKRADGIVSLSPKTISYLTKRYSYPEEKVVLIPNGTHVSQSFDPELQHNDVLKFMYVGGVDKVHKLQDLITAFKIVEKTNQNIRFEIVGSGKDKQNLIHLAKAQKLRNLIFSDAVKKSEVPKKLKKADALFLSTGEVYYGSENKLGEYLSAGKPVITYTPAKHNDIVEQYHCGLSATYPNIEHLAETILTMAELSDEERLEMGKNGFQYAKDHLSIEKLAGDLSTFFTKIGGWEGKGSAPIVREASPEDLPDIARLHKEQIPTGFLSSLPLSVLIRLYNTIYSSDLLFVISEKNSILGFVSASHSTSELYRRFILKSLIPLVPVIIGLLFRKGFIKSVFETLAAPRKTHADKKEDDMPELLSIVVKPGCQAGGLGLKLLNRLEQELKKRNVLEYKVVAGEKLVSANRFYKKYGFQAHHKTEIHKGDVSNVYVKSLLS